MAAPINRCFLVRASV